MISDCSKPVANSIVKFWPIWRLAILQGLLLSSDKPEYLFTLEPHALADFADRCRFSQTSPESSFTQKRVCTLATATGRITLRDDRLLITENGVKREEPVADWHAALRERFGVEIS